MNECRILWNGVGSSAWRELFSRVRRSNLLQSPDYALAVCPLQQQRIRQGLIMIGGQEAGLAQIQEAGIFGNAVHALILDRGPLWLDEFGTAAHNASFFGEFSRQFPLRFGRRRRIIPEIENTAENRRIMQQSGYERLDSPGYQTVWIDLAQTEDSSLWAMLDSSWRNKVGKARRAGLRTEWDVEGAHFSWLLNRYQSDRMQRGYDGPSAQVLKALARTFGQSRRMILGRALAGQDPVAGVLIFLHGCGATYQVGWTSEDGKKTAAHNLLLWDALDVLRKNGIKDFDLGGINDDSAKGVRTFKEGMGGKTVALAGQYR